MATVRKGKRCDWCKRFCDQQRISADQWQCVECFVVQGKKAKPEYSIKGKQIIRLGYMIMLTGLALFIYWLIKFIAYYSIELAVLFTVFLIGFLTIGFGTSFRNKENEQ